MTMKLKNRYLLAVLTISSAVVLLLLSAGFAGYWLQSEDQPEQSDAIVTLAGNPTRAFYAADLYLKGYAAQIYVSKPIRSHEERMLDESGIPFPFAEEIYRQVLLKKGVPDSHIQIFGKSSMSTAEEAEVLKGLFKGTNYKLLIVTSPYHTRRAKMIFKDYLAGYDIKVVGTPYESFPVKWWTEQDAAKNLILEVFKILYYKTGGSFHSRNES